MYTQLLFLSSVQWPSVCSDLCIAISYTRLWLGDSSGRCGHIADTLQKNVSAILDKVIVIASKEAC